MIKHHGELLHAEYGETCSLTITIARDRTITFIERWEVAGARFENTQPK